jgi:hypothetical protein
MEFSNILVHLNPTKLRHLYMNYIQISQKSDVETIRTMLSQVKLLSQFDGKTTQVRIGECKHQIKFLEVLMLLFEHLTSCELIVTNLK